MLLLLRLVLTLNLVCYQWTCGSAYYFPHPTQQQQQQYNERPFSAPFLALVTEPDACSTYKRYEETLKALERAIQTDRVTLLCIRLGNEDYDVDLLNLLCLRVKHLLEHQKSSCSIVVNVHDAHSSFHIAIDNGLHGIHVKERDIETIQMLQQQNFIVGASAHTIESAIQAAQFGAQYIFVGTCFETKSHPEKKSRETLTQTEEQTFKLEGPKLPGMVQRELSKLGYPYNTIPVFAIGGINERNCLIPIQAGASGIAVMRAVLCSSDPYRTTINLYNQIRVE
jgi:thiamine-phosphate diphosphorylase